MSHHSPRCFVPLIIYAEFDSPIDALLSLCVPHNEVMNLVAASWLSDGQDCVATKVDGGRAVAVLRLPEGGWAACNAYPQHACATRSEAERRLAKLSKRHQRGCIGVLAQHEWLALLPTKI